MNYPKISIITPSYNLGAYLEQTIKSVVEQNYPNLEYIIIDGGSTDHSLDIIKKYEKYLSYWVSEPDQGLYHALQKGFDQSSGELMGWLNADDMLYPQSLFTIAGAFADVPQVQWLQGYPTVFDKMGRVIYHRPPRFSKYSFYLKDYHDGKFIQQESTYWRRDLWDSTGGYISQMYPLAGDFELWMRFFNYASLHITLALVGGFRVRGSEQLSHQHRKQYIREADAVIDTYRSAASKKDQKIIRKLARLRTVARYFPKGKVLLQYLPLYQKYINQASQINYDVEQNKFSQFKRILKQ